MSEMAKKTKEKTVSFKRLLKLGGLLFVFVYIIFTFAKQQIYLSKCDDISKSYEEKIAEVKLEQQRLEDELDKADTDEYLERMAREKLGLIKANERIFVDVTKR